METTSIVRADQAPHHLQRAAKVALCVGASVMLNADREGLLVEFKESDKYYFDPENVTLHTLEALGHARTYGFLQANVKAVAIDQLELLGWVRFPAVIRIVHSSADVRVQIGARKWHRDVHANTAIAMRHAIVDAFCGYYDDAIKPYTEA
jgi:hypothetical protein